MEDKGRVRNYSLFPDDENRRFAVYYLELDPESFWESEPHLKGTTEFITVFAGSWRSEPGTGSLMWNKEKVSGFRETGSIPTGIQDRK